MNKFTIVMYHYTRDISQSRYPRIKALDSKLFKNQIEFFVNHFIPIKVEDIQEALSGGRPLPKNALLLTFDDGYIDNYTVAFPVLDSYGIQGVFFPVAKTLNEHSLLDVNKIHYLLASGNEKEILRSLLEKIEFYRKSGYSISINEELLSKYTNEARFDSTETAIIKRMLQTVIPYPLRSKIASELFNRYVDVSERKLAYELYLNEDQILAMKRHGMAFGLHGYEHSWLGNLEKEEMEQDIDRALSVMDPFIDSSCWVMNYPYGNYSNAVVEFVKSRGAILGLTTQVAVADLNADNPLLLPRFDCNDFPPKSESNLER